MSLPSVSGMLSGQHGYAQYGHPQGGWGPHHGGFGPQYYQGGQGGQGIPAEEPSKPQLPFIPAQPPVAQNPQFNAKEVKQGGSQHGPGQIGPGFFPHGGPHPGFGPHGQWGQDKGNKHNKHDKHDKHGNKQQGGYPPQQGGYPPQQGGYPPQQGGYPPQQGGYPPQQGGYPPQQGGYGYQKTPESAHEHPLNYNQKLNENCKICMQRVPHDGYKCGNCPMVLCMNCANRIFYGNKKNQFMLMIYY